MSKPFKCVLVCHVGQFLAVLKVGSLLGQRLRVQIVQLVSILKNYFNVNLFCGNKYIYMCIHNYAHIIICQR